MNLKTSQLFIEFVYIQLSNLKFVGCKRSIYSLQIFVFNSFKSVARGQPHHSPFSTSYAPVLVVVNTRWNSIPCNKKSAFSQSKMDLFLKASFWIIMWHFQTTCYKNVFHIKILKDFCLHCLSLSVFTMYTKQQQTLSIKPKQNNYKMHHSSFQCWHDSPVCPVATISLHFSSLSVWPHSRVIASRNSYHMPNTLTL